MAEFYGTDESDRIEPGILGPGVYSDQDGAYPGDAADTIHGQGGNDRILSGGGNDVVYTGGGHDTVYAGSGHDRIEVENTDSDIEVRWLYGEGGNDVIVGNYSEDHIFGGSEDDWIDGGVLGDHLDAGSGSDRMFGGHGDDRLDGGSGSDQMFGGSGGDTYFVDGAGDHVEDVADNGEYDQGGEYYDAPDQVYASVSFTLGANVEHLALVGTTAAGGTGNGANNNLYGNSFVNTLRGLGGSDTFRSGNGADVLIGGSGNDLFQYLTVTGSTPTSRDIIRAGDGATAFQAAGAALGDRFDFSQVDANTQAANVQDFVFGTATGRGRLWAATSGSNTLIRGNTDSDTAAELEITIEDGAVLASAYTSADFLL